MRLVRHEIFLRPRNRKLLHRARSYAGRKEWNLAKKSYRDLLDVKGDRPAVWMQYGHSCKEAGDVAEAEHAYRTAARLTPHAAEPHKHLGFLLKSLNRQDESVDAFLRGVAAEPRATDLQLELQRFGLSTHEISTLSALSALELGGLTKVERRLLRAPVVGLLAEIFALPIIRAAAKRGFWDIATKGYRQLHKIRPANPNLAVQLGHAHKELGELEEARLAYREAFAWSPWHADAYLHMGHIAKLLGDREAAKYWYFYTWRLAPNTYGLAQELQAFGLQQEALSKMFRQVWLSHESADQTVPSEYTNFILPNRRGNSPAAHPPEGMSLSALSFWFSMAKNADKWV